jgi:hypothetical protein
MCLGANVSVGRCRTTFGSWLVPHEEELRLGVVPTYCQAVGTLCLPPTLCRMALRRRQPCSRALHTKRLYLVALCEWVTKGVQLGPGKTAVSPLHISSVMCVVSDGRRCVVCLTVRSVWRDPPTTGHYIQTIACASCPPSARDTYAGTPTSCGCTATAWSRPPCASSWSCCRPP